MLDGIQLDKLLSLDSILTYDAEGAGGARLHQRSMVAMSMLVMFAAILWGSAYWLLDEPLSGLIPFSYALYTAVSLLLMRTRKYTFDQFRNVQLAITLLLPFLLMLSLGGFVNGSVVIVWAFLAPLGALLGRWPRIARSLLAGYLILLVVAAVLQPWLRTENHLPAIATTFFFVLNIGTVSLIAFVVLSYFVGQQDLAVRLLQEKRELEAAYMDQEIMLRQSEKLATLGRLSAGLAHELNNPASAAQRSAQQLSTAIERLEEAQLRLARPVFSASQFEAFQALAGLAHEGAGTTRPMSPVERDDCERRVEEWLESHGIEEAWHYAPNLASMSCDVARLEAMTAAFTPEQLPVAVAGLCSTFTVHRLLNDLAQGAGRITEIVTALKSYTYVDRGTRQRVDVHAGLDNTLIILQSKLAKGIVVKREYAEGLPAIEANGGELNQVWTNIIDNAIYAMEGQGELELKTYADGPWLVVEIADTGPGIAEEIRAKIFDPFETTKPPGEGTGLGLNISHNIIVQKHHGTIDVSSGTDGTRFRVRLPIDAAPPA